MNNFELIENIQARRPLWDKSTWDKTDINSREELWEQVAAKMGSTKDIVKARWKNLRDSYRKIIKKRENLEIDDPKWSYFKAMEFMRDITINTKPRNIDISVRKSEVVSIEPDYSITLVSTTDDEGSIDPLSYGNQAHPARLPNSKHELKGAKRHAAEDLVTQFLEIETDKAKSDEERQAAVAAAAAAAARVMHEDDDYQFLLSLYPHFKQVPHSRKLPLRMRIEQLIYEEIYAHHHVAASLQQKTSCSFQM